MVHNATTHTQQKGLSVCLSTHAPPFETKVVHANAQNVSRDLLASRGDTKHGVMRSGECSQCSNAQVQYSTVLMCFAFSTPSQRSASARFHP